jgi:hypothetical protein
VKEDDSQSDHNSGQAKQRQAFLNIILKKFDAIEHGLEDGDGPVFFMDSDMLFVNPLEDRFHDLLNNPSVDFMISPHHTGQLAQIENKYGFYNVGFFSVRHKESLKTWKDLTINHEKLGLYYEQKPFELILKNYMTVNLPMNYNIGWWRFNSPQTKARLKQLYDGNKTIMFGESHAVNFHFHVYKEPNGFNPGRFLVDKVFNFLKESENKKHKELLKFHEALSKTTV